MTTGGAGTAKDPVAWRQFDWSKDQIIGDCIVHAASWRFYENGLICLELRTSKDRAGQDTSDIVGHRIELHDSFGFLIGIWSAGFLVNKDTHGRCYQTSAEDAHMLLKLHYAQLAETQTAQAFRI